MRRRDVQVETTTTTESENGLAEFHWKVTGLDSPIIPATHLDPPEGGQEIEEPELLEIRILNEDGHDVLRIPFSLVGCFVGMGHWGAKHAPSEDQMADALNEAYPGDDQ